MIADIMTKPLGRIKHQKFCDLAGISPINQNELEGEYQTQSSQ
jgi:hypothetical protein